MTISVISGLIVLIILIVGYGCIKLVHFAGQVRDVDAKEIQHYVQHRQHYINFFAKY